MSGVQFLPISDFPLAVVDVETTGSSPRLGDRIVEVGMIRVERGQIVRRYQQLVYPGRGMSAGASRITGITNVMLADQPRFEQVLPDIAALFRDAVVVGHNVGFDLGFLEHEFTAAGERLESILGPRPMIIDTLAMARRRFGKSGNALGKLAGKLGVDPDGAHRALPDCQTTLDVLVAMIEVLEGWATPIGQIVTGRREPRPAVRRSPIPPPQAPPTLTSAIAERAPVVIEYVNESGEPTTRTVVPLAVVRGRQGPVLRAFCMLRQETRIFYLERIVRVDLQMPDSDLGGSV